MKKSHKRTQLDISQKFSNAMKAAGGNSINSDFNVTIMHYTVGSPAGILLFDNCFNSFLICLYEDTDIQEIVHDLAKKSYKELEKKYLEGV